MYRSIALESLIVIHIIYVNTSSGHNFERIDVIASAPFDRYEYRGLKLDNGMKVMLISDPLAVKSAASMVIGTGALYDHQLVPGLANLVGHILLETGGKNSQSSSFKRFIESRGGTVDGPNTLEADQNFSFEVHHFHFVDALNEFAQLFLEPRLSYESNPNLMRKPLQSLQEEFNRNMQDDDARVLEVLKSVMSKKKHCYNHLFCGNIDLLYQHVRNSRVKKSKHEQNESLFEKVKAFHDTWYSSNLMTLAVLGNGILEGFIIDRVSTSITIRRDDKDASLSSSTFDLKSKSKIQVRYSQILPWSRLIALSRHFELDSEACNIHHLEICDGYVDAVDVFIVFYNTSTQFLKGSLDDLEQMVIPLFENVQNKKREKIVYTFDYHPWGKMQLRNEICIAPLNDSLQVLALIFPLPDFRDYYEAAPEDYVGHYLTYTSYETLTSELRRRNWCTSLTFDFWTSAGFAFVKLKFELTDYGLIHMHDVTNLTFQYIYMLKENGVKDWMNKELQKFHRRAFFYHNIYPGQPLNFVKNLAYKMQKDRPMQLVLINEFFRNQWNPAVIHHFLSFLRPGNMNLVLVSKFCGTMREDKLFRETHYGVLHRIVKITEEHLTKWETMESSPPLHLPMSNDDLIPEKWESFTRSEDEPLDPYIIHKSSISEFWFKQDNFVIPEICIHLELTRYEKFRSLGPGETIYYNLRNSSYANIDPVAHVSWRLFHYLLKSLLHNFVHVPKFKEHTLVAYDVTLIDRGTVITVNGSNDKVPVLLAKLLSKMTRLEHFLTEKVFADSLKKYLQLMKEEMRENHFYQSNWAILEYTKYTEDNWEMESNINIGSRLQFADMKKFLRKVFRRIFIRCFVYGNYTKQKALDVIVNIVQNSFPSSHGLLWKETLRPRFIDIEDKFHYFYQVFNKINNLYSSAYLFSLESDLSNPMNPALSVFLHLIMDDACPKFLDVKIEGFFSPSIECSLSQMYPLRGFVIKVISQKVPRNIDLRLEKFLDNMPSIIMDLRDEQFISLKKELENYFRPSSLKESSERYWFEISNRSYRFDRNDMDVNISQTIEKSDLVAFFKENLHKSASRRRKLTVHILPREIEQTRSTVLTQIPSGATKIEDIYSYKTSSTLLPYEFRFIQQ